MNTITGGCHFDCGCGRYHNGCGKCPQLGSQDQDDPSSRIWKRKKRAFDATPPDRLHFVALNNWMAREIQASPLTSRFDVSVIPNGVDTDVFVPQSRAGAREQLGLPLDAKVVMFVADSLRNPRKGYAILEQVMQNIVKSDGVSGIHLLSVGTESAPTNDPYRRTHLGRLDEASKLAVAYNAADVFVIPSLQDNLPNTVLEALSCGTPVVGFSTGGIAEMVDDGVTGFLAPVGDGEGLGRGIIRVLRDTELAREMRAKCREVAIQRYTREAQVLKYQRLANFMISKSTVS